MAGKGFGFHRDVDNDELDVLVAGTIALSVSTTNLTLPTGGFLTTNDSLAHGYATGAGGAATQTGNKQTTVEINNVCGTITTHVEALAAAAETTFQVDCDPVAIGDVIILSIQSGGTSGEYVAFVSEVAANQFDVTLGNMSGSSASDVVLINFAVIKAVSA